MMTMHASKGLDWSVIANNSKRDFADVSGGIVLEARLAYVDAMSTI